MESFNYNNILKNSYDDMNYNVNVSSVKGGFLPNGLGNSYDGLNNSIENFTINIDDQYNFDDDKENISLNFSNKLSFKNTNQPVSDRGYSFAFTDKLLGAGNYKQVFETTAYSKEKTSIDAVYCQFGFAENNSKKKGMMTPEEVRYEKNLWDHITPLDQEKNTGLAKYLGHYEDKSTQKVYMVFEKYIDGTLEANLYQLQRCQPSEIKTVVHDILLGVKTLHDKKIVHLDLKPDNILLKKDSNGKIIGAAITDLGLSRHLKEGEKVFPKGLNKKYAPKEFFTYIYNHKKAKPEEKKSLGSEAYGYDIYSLGLIFESVLNTKSSKAMAFCNKMTHETNKERGNIDDHLKEFEKLEEEAFTFKNEMTHHEIQFQPYFGNHENIDNSEYEPFK